MFKKYIGATNHHFPALESLILRFEHGPEPEIPATFLRGPDRSDLPLQRLRLYGASPASVSGPGLLSSVTALTDLTLNITSKAALFESQGSSLLTCLQGMQCLRSLYLTTEYYPRDPLPESEHSVPKDIAIPMSTLTRFHYSGFATVLDDLMSGLSAPSLRDARFMLWNKIPLQCLPRVIDDVRREFRSVSVAFYMKDPCFHLLSSTDSGDIDHFKPSPFRFLVNRCPFSIELMSSIPSTKLAMAEELTLNFPSSDLNMKTWDHHFSFCGFLRQFRSVKVLRVNPFMREVGLWLRQGDDGETIMHLLEKFELSISCSGGRSDEKYEILAAEAPAAFEPCERAGRIVQVYHSEQTWTLSGIGRSIQNSMADVLLSYSS
jgi:hypothetical protein